MVASNSLFTIIVFIMGGALAFKKSKMCRQYFRNQAVRITRTGFDSFQKRLLPPAILALVMISGSSASALTLDERVTILEKTVFTKEDAAAMRAEQKAEREADKAERKAEMAVLKAEREADKAERKAEMAVLKVDMATMTLENRLFSLATLGLSTVVPSLSYVRLLAQDEKEKLEKEEEKLEKEREKEERIEKEREKEMKGKNRTFSKDFSSFIKYLT